MQERLCDSYSELLRLDVRSNRVAQVSPRQRLVAGALTVGLPAAKRAEQLIRKRCPNKPEQVDAHLIPWDEVLREHLALIALWKVRNPKYRAALYLDWVLREPLQPFYRFFTRSKKALNKYMYDARSTLKKELGRLRKIATQGGTKNRGKGLPRVIWTGLSQPGTPICYTDVLHALCWLRNAGERLP